MALEIRFHPAETAGELTLEWDRLYAADPEAQFFLSRPFLAPILAHAPGEHVLLTAWNNGRLVALAALYHRLVWDGSARRYRTDFLFSGTRNWADYNGFLIAPEDDIATMRGLAAFLKDQPWARLRLKNLRMGPARQTALLAAFDAADFGHRAVSKMINGGATNNLICPAIALPDRFEDYLAARSRNTRQKLRRLLRQLDGGAFNIREGAPADLPDFALMWAQLWERKKDRVKLSQTYARILSEGFEAGTLSLPVLTRDDRPIGYLANFRDPVKKTISFFVSARDPAIRDTPIGLMMHADAIRAAIADGYRRYDMLRGDEPYKLQLGGVAEEIRYSVLRRRSRVPSGQKLSGLSAHALRADIATQDGSRARIGARQLKAL